MRRIVGRNFYPFELSPKEQQVYNLLMEGLFFSEIAVEMQIGIKTVRAHAYHIKGKLDLAKKTSIPQGMLRKAAGHREEFNLKRPIENQPAD